MKISVKLIRTEYPPNDGVMPGNPQFDDLFESIKREGMHEPLTINLGWFVINGNHRLSVAKHLGMKHVDVRVWTGTEFIQ